MSEICLSSRLYKGMIYCPDRLIQWLTHHSPRAHDAVVHSVCVSQFNYISEVKESKQF